MTGSAGSSPKRDTEAAKVVARIYCAAIAARAQAATDRNAALPANRRASLPMTNFSNWASRI